MKTTPILLVLLSVLRPAFAIGQTIHVPLLPQKGNPSSANHSTTSQDREPPCPKGRKQTDEAKYGDYVIRTYRWPEPEGCLQVVKGGKLVYSLDSDDFRIGKNFADDAEIAVGTDITGLGKPNAIVSEWSGGAHCCFTTHVFELGQVFREVGRIKADHSDGAKFVDPNHDGAYQFEGNDWAFAYWRTSFMSSPVPRIVLKYRNGRFRIAYDSMKKPEPSAQEFAAMLRAVQSDQQWAEGDSPNCAANCGVPVLLWSDMLDLMYTGHVGIAWRLLNQSWPSGRKDETDFAIDFCKQLRASRYWPELKPEIGPCPYTLKPHCPPIMGCEQTRSIRPGE